MEIWKFPLGYKYGLSIQMPQGSKILCIQMQDGQPHMWAMVDPSKPEENRHFEIFGTGWKLDEDIKSNNYIGTFQQGNGLVYHVFEVVK